MEVERSVGEDGEGFSKEPETQRARVIEGELKQEQCGGGARVFIRSEGRTGLDRCSED